MVGKITAVEKWLGKLLLFYVSDIDDSL